MNRFATLSFDGEAVTLLDQRRLPTEETFVRAADWRAVADAIRDMVVRGAPAIGVTAAYGLVLAARGGEAELLEAAAGLRATRPTAVNLFWAIDRMLARAARTDEAHRVEALREEAQAIHDEDAAMCLAMGEHGADLLPPGARVLTHCNAGALATAGAGTALAVLRAAHRRGRLAMVYADETRPFLQGARLTAWELHRDGLPVRVITDNMAAHFMKAGAIDAAVVGADRVAANGDFANKIGTYGVAVACAYHGLPLYVVAPTSTLDLATLDGAGIPIEQRPESEVRYSGDRQVVPAGVPVENPAFDVTPAALVTAIVTERGVARPPFTESLARLRS